MFYHVHHLSFEVEESKESLFCFEMLGDERDGSGQWVLCEGASCNFNTFCPIFHWFCCLALCICQSFSFIFQMPPRLETDTSSLVFFFYSDCKSLSHFPCADHATQHHHLSLQTQCALMNFSLPKKLTPFFLIRKCLQSLLQILKNTIDSLNLLFFKHPQANINFSSPPTTHNRNLLNTHYLVALVF